MTKPNLDGYGRTAEQARRFNKCFDYAAKQLASIKQFVHINDSTHDVYFDNTDTQLDLYILCNGNSIVAYDKLIEHIIARLTADDFELLTRIQTIHVEGFDDEPLADLITTINAKIGEDGKPMKNMGRNLDLTDEMCEQFRKSVDAVAVLLPKLVEAVESAKLANEIAKL